MIDLRSDTVTRPSPAMREAMAQAVVGDDVYGDDPTVKRLEARTAELLGKEDAVYMPTGSMTNQVAIRAHTEPGDRVIMDIGSHVVRSEGGGPAALSGVTVQPLLGDRGIYTTSQLRDALGVTHPGSPTTLTPPATLLTVENTHNGGGGSIWPLELVDEVVATARAAGLRCHLDGARVWNASAATGIPPARYARDFDSVSVCFSKALGAPVGSALAGSRTFVARARRFKQQFGGGFRQAGIIAAGALYALETIGATWPTTTRRRGTSPMCWCRSRASSWCASMWRPTSCASTSRAPPRNSWTRAWRGASPCWFRESAPCVRWRTGTCRWTTSGQRARSCGTCCSRQNVKATLRSVISTLQFLLICRRIRGFQQLFDLRNPLLRLREAGQVGTPGGHELEEHLRDPSGEFPMLLD